ncbi:LysE family transporter [Achromobacter insuavis]
MAASPVLSPIRAPVHGQPRSGNDGMGSLDGVCRVCGAHDHQPRARQHAAGHRGGRYGLRGSVPFWVGFEAANLALCALYGLGLGGALHEHPQIHVALKWMGVLYLLYLAWGFFRASAKPASQAADTRPLGFVDGFICVILNPKIHSMIAVMFAQFLLPGVSLSLQVGQLSAAFVILGLFCHFPWIYGGKVILGRFNRRGRCASRRWYSAAPCCWSRCTSY